MLNCTAQPEQMPSAPRPHRASCLGNEGCAAFKCLVHLWEWLDPPTLITSTSMDSKKGQPTTQQPLQQRPVHLHTNPVPSLAVHLNSPQPGQLPTNGIVHQLLMQSPGYHQHSSTISQDARTPLLENNHEQYGTQQLSDYLKPRQYGTRERENLYSPQTPQTPQTPQSPPSQLPINYDSRNMNAGANAVPLGYNVDVHNAYLLRNPPKEQNQIYQNHQGLYRSPEIEYGSKSYIPYTNTLQAPAPSNTEMLKQQYNEIQQMRLQQQMHYQNRAQMHQQQIFAERQLLLQQMHGVQPPPNLRQDLELIASKEAEGSRNKMLYEMSLGKEELYGEDQFYGKDLSLEKELANRKNQLKGQEQNYSRDQNYSKEYKEPGTDSSNSQRQLLKRESRERERYQVQGHQITPPSSKSPESTNTSIKSPSSESRRSSTGNQALRSPIAQRPASAPVTMSGWLYKQGSDGLKVWRKRWFVLSEYCLFYYKSQEEDKLLGSVLLPSYVVRACEADERVSRRHSFKCEHANMRTLLLAAPDDAAMQAWLRALTCAALMQEGSVHELTNNSNEEVREYGQENDNEMSEEDGSPGHTYANAPPKPRRSNDGYNSPSPERYESNYDLLRKPQSSYNQSSRTPTQAENIYDKQPIENYKDSGPITFHTKFNQGPASSAAEALENSRVHLYKHQRNQYMEKEDAKTPIYSDDMKKKMNNRTDQLSHDRNTEKSQSSRQLTDKSMLKDLTNWNIYESHNVDTEYKRTLVESTYGTRPVHDSSHKSVTNNNISDIRRSHLDIRNENVHAINTKNAKVPYYESNNTLSERIERRTPDAYGRSLIMAGYNSNGKSSDYEDIYPKYPAGKEYRSSYKSSVNSDVYDEKRTNQNDGYNQNIYERNLLSPTKGVHYVPSVLRRTKAQNVNSQVEGVLRPHSADFLQNEHTAPRPPHLTHSTQRPKSSLDINSYYDPSSDSYYSEESYAAKMRQSAQYLPSSGLVASALAARLNTPLPLLDLSEDKQYTPSESYATNNISRSDVLAGANTSHYLDKDNVSYDSSKYADSSSLNSNWTLKDNRKLSLENETCNRSTSAAGDSFKGGENALGGDCFVRSASARLPSDVQEYHKDQEKKVHQREESMKRLLEWKQRMLQSPLTRKSTPTALMLARTLHRHTVLPQPTDQTADIVESRPIEQAGRPRDPPLALSAPSTNSTSHKHLCTDLSDEEKNMFVHAIPASDIKQNETLCNTENETLGDKISGDSELDVSKSENDTGTSHQIKLSINKSLIDDCEIKQLKKAKMSIDKFNPLNDESFDKDKDEVYIGSQVKLMQKVDIIPAKRYSDYEKKLSESFEDNIHMCKDQNLKQTPMENEAESATDMEYTDDDLDEVLMDTDEEKESADNNVKETNHNIQDIDDKIQATESRDEKYRRISEDVSAINMENRMVTESISHSEETVPKITMTTPIPHAHEDHYLPMTPRKSSHTINTYNSFTSVFESGYTGGHEDNNYVEMGQGMAVDNVFGNDAYEVVCINNNGRVEPVYMELTTPNQLQDIESNLQIPPEPPEPNQKDTRSSHLNLSESTAMDKSTLKRGDKPKRDETLKSPLPDILLNSNKSILKSDSSDADDEASKDFSIDRPFSRFSLSDTFRPASYYLGSSRTLLEFQDSSDSDIVFPPSVRAPSPPAEDLDSFKTLVQKKLDEKSLTPALDNEFGHSKFDTIKRKTTSLMIYGSTPSVHDTLFRGEKIRRSRASLTNDSKIKENIESLPSSNNGLFKSCNSVDSESVISYNADRCSSKMSLDSDISSKFEAITSNVSSSLNLASISTSTHGEELERISKRRPISDESFLEVDKYLGNLQLNDFSMPEVNGSLNDNILRRYGATKFDSEAVGYYNKRVAAIQEERQYENINIQESLKISHSRSVSSPVNSSRTPPSRPLSSCSANSSSTNLKNTTKVVTENNQILDNDKYCEQLSGVFENPNTEQIPMSYYSKSAMQDDDIIEKNLNKYNSNCGTLSKVKTASFENTILKTSAESSLTEHIVPQSGDCRSSDISHSRDSSEHSAPYYYSDLSSQEHVDIISAPQYIKTNNLSKKLNNQRTCKGHASRKNEIMHIHNPIHSNLVTNEMHGLNDESFNIAAAAQSVSVEFLSATDKTAEIDLRNIYESDTIRRQRIKDCSSSLYISPDSKNIYPHVTDGNSFLSVSRIGNDSRQSNQSLDLSFNDSRASSVRNDSSHKNGVSPNRSASQINDAYNNLLTPSDFNLCHTVEEERTKQQERHIALATRYEADNLWDEDTLWRENLRRASQRHARSMDDLDCLSNSDHVSGRFSVDLKSMHGSKKTSKSIKAKSAKINRTVTYVNDDSLKEDTSKRKFYKNKVSQVKSENKQDDNDVYVQLVSKESTAGAIRDVLDEGVYERLAFQAANNESNANVTEEQGNLISISEIKTLNRVNSADSIRASESKKKRFEIDREKLRQWDLMSSGLMKNEWYKVGGSGGVGGLSVGNAGHVDKKEGANHVDHMDHQSDVNHGSNADRASFTRELEFEAIFTGNEAASGHHQLQTANKKSLGGSNPSISRPARDTIPIRAVSPRVRWATEKPSQNQGQEDMWNGRQDARVAESGVGVGDGVPWAMAGVGGACALLGRSHGELQELLGELRERHAAHATVVHRTNQQIRHLQSVLGTPEFPENRQEKLEQLEKLKLQLVELERQYAASRPLMQLVDSMVRLGALYPRSAVQTQPAALDRLERNTHVRHQLLLEQAQEQRRLAESTENLSREQIQRKMEQLWALDRELSSETGTLQELKADKEAIEKVLGGVRDKMDSKCESDAEANLAHVYSMLAHNSKKLEQTVGDNARLERELAALRDSLQGHSTHRTTALLEDELRRVRQLVFELQKQRQELSSAVRRLTESANLVAATPSGSVYKERTPNMNWLETDLDSGHSVEHGAEEEVLTPPAYPMSVHHQSGAWTSSSQDARQPMMPLYVDTRPAEPDLDSILSPTTSDDGTQSGFGNLNNVEKQEIKTVRIVKRESERRHRDRDRSLQTYPCDWGQSLHPTDLTLAMSHNEHFARAASLPRTAYSNMHKPNQHAPSSTMGLSMPNKTHPPSHLSLSNVNVPQNMSSSWQYDSAKYQSSPTLPISNDDSSWYSGSHMSHSYNVKRVDLTGTARSMSSHGDSMLHRNRTTSGVPVSLSGAGSVASLSSSVSALSPPTFSSEAARQIMSEVREVPAAVRRAVPRERRRHHTAPLRLSADALQHLPKNDGFNYNTKKGSGRWLDDTDMERALRGSGRDEMGVTDGTGVTGRDRPDVVRCAAPPVAKLTDAALIDQLLFAPRKILIPERYIPEKPPELSHEEQQKRLEKVESIKKMLSSGASASDPAKQSPGGDDKKQRQHLLHMNQILAQQVMEMSKIVAVKALQNIPLDDSYGSDSEDRSPDVELPVYQQRDNFFT